jgi:prepilin peptidase CpaA
MIEILSVLTAATLITAAVTDLRSRRIPNLLTYPMMAAALVCHLAATGGGGLLFALSGLALGIAVFIIPYAMGGMGAGDVKLMGSVGAALGAKGVLMAAVYTGLIGGLYAVALMLVHRRESRGIIARYATTFKTLAFTGEFIPIPASENEKKPKLCYGVVIAMGTLCYMIIDKTGSNFLTF